MEVLYLIHRGKCDCFQMNASISRCNQSFKAETRPRGELEVKEDSRPWLLHFTKTENSPVELLFLELLR